MNIGVDIRIIGKGYGGIGRYTLELVKNILRIDKKTQYYLFYNEDSLDSEVRLTLQQPNVRLVKANCRHYSFKEQVKFLIILNKHRLDLVHFPNFNVPIFYNRPFVVTIHDMVHHKIGGAKKANNFSFLAYKLVIKKAAQNAKLIITVSESSKKDISNYLQTESSKVKVVYPGVSLSGEANSDRTKVLKEKLFLKKPYFLFVGVLERKKNLISLARGFDKFLSKYKYDMDLVIAGKTDEHYPNIKFEALKIKHKAHLIFTDLIDDSDLSVLYKNAYAFVSASMNEGFGLPGAEAMKFGLPLIVANMPVFNEIYDDAAIYFDATNPEDIAEKLSLLINDSLFYNKLQENSTKRSVFFSWENAAKETLDLYSKLI